MPGVLISSGMLQTDDLYSELFADGPLTHMATLCPPVVIHMVNTPWLSLFLATFPIICIIPTH